MANHIHNIEIKNFKSIRHQKIEDCRRVNVFVGYPNTGKSNILEAMSLISYLKKENNLPLNYLCRFKKLIDVFYDGNKQKDAEVFVDDYVFSLRYIDSGQLDLAIIERKNYVPNFNSATADIIKNLSFARDGRILHTDVKDYTEGQIVLKKYQFDISHSFPGLSQTVLNFPFGTNLGEVLRYNNNLRKETGELFSTYNLRLVFDEEGNIEVQKQLDEYTAFKFSFTQVADTLQRLIFHKAAIATNEHSVLLFEEPEAHMFPPYISKFTADVIYDENNNQYFIATHSPFVLNDFMEDMDKENLAIYAVGYKKETGETIIRRLTDDEITEIYQYGIDLFFNLENFLKDAV